MNEIAFKQKMSNSQIPKNKNSLSNYSSSDKNSIYFVGGEKGGVGKSFFSRCMLDYFVAKKWTDKFTLIEADPTINDVSSVYSDSYDKVMFSDNKFQRNEPDLIIDKAEDKTVIVNLPSNVCLKFDSWLNRSNLLSSTEAKDYYNKLVYFFVSDGCYRSIDLFVSQIQQYSMNDFPHCLVLNTGRLTCAGTFHYLEEYKPLMEVIKTFDIPVLMLPELDADLQFRCDRYSLSYRSLSNGQKYVVKQKVKNFLRQVDALFDNIFPQKINQPDGLTKIALEQKEYRQQDRLPIPTKAEILAS